MARLSILFIIKLFFNYELYSISISTGVATLIGRISPNVTSTPFLFQNSGILYLMYESSGNRVLLSSLSKTNAAATQIALISTGLTSLGSVFTIGRYRSMRIHQARAYLQSLCTLSLPRRGL